MKATGIVRRIDDLGRVVVPKEIRRTLRIREGDPMEIYTAREGEVVLKKYSPMGEMGRHVEEYAKSISHIINFTTIITDRDQVVVAAGKEKKEYLNKSISHLLEEIMEEREAISNVRDEKKKIPIYEGEDISDVEQIIRPIICHGDVVGAIAVLSKNKEDKLTSTEEKIVAIGALYLGSQMES